MRDELFQPTIQERAEPGRPPWRPEMILYPAFFGGPLAGATLGVLNGRRLGLPAERLLLIASAGLIAFVSRIAIAATVAGTAPARLGGVVGGVLVWLVVVLLQRREFRTYTYRGGEPVSLFRAGVAAAVGLGFFEIVVLALVAG
jgi:hypothetical protein